MRAGGLICLREGRGRLSVQGVMFLRRPFHIAISHFGRLRVPSPPPPFLPNFFLSQQILLRIAQRQESYPGPMRTATQQLKAGSKVCGGDSAGDQ